MLDQLNLFHDGLMYISSNVYSVILIFVNNVLNALMTLKMPVHPVIIKKKKKLKNLYSEIIVQLLKPLFMKIATI